MTNRRSEHRQNCAVRYKSFVQFCVRHLLEMPAQPIRAAGVQAPTSVCMLGQGLQAAAAEEALARATMQIMPAVNRQTGSQAHELPLASQSLWFQELKCGVAYC